MTEQYAQRNINQQGDSNAFVATVAVPDVTLTSAVQLLQIDTTLAASIATLPLADSAGPNAVITVVKTVAANTVTLAAPVTNTLVAAAGVVNPIAGQWGSLTVKSDPANNRWIVIGGTV